MSQARGRTCFLLTGATGFLGRRLLARMLRNGDQVIVLCRAQSQRATAQERMNALVTELECGPYRAGLSVIDADMACLDPAALSTQLNNVLLETGMQRLVAVNVAGSLVMDHPAQKAPKRAAVQAQNHATNVAGLENLLGALDRLDAMQAPNAPVLAGVVHYSTCYAHGRTRGLIPEGPIDPGTACENSYEHTKRLGEYALTQWHQNRSRPVPVTVIRPSIVTGPDTPDGYLAFLDTLAEPSDAASLSGWKRWLVGRLAGQPRTVDLMAAVVRRLHLPWLPLLGNGQGVLDLIDAADVDRYGWEVVQHHRSHRGAELRFLHLANPGAPTLHEVVHLTLGAFGHATMANRVRLIDGVSVFLALLHLFSMLPIAGSAMRRLYSRTVMLRPYLMRPIGTRFATSQTVRYFEAHGLRYAPRQIDVPYVQSLIAKNAAPNPEPVAAATPDRIAAEPLSS